jgi:hypothetical protein
MPFLQTQQFTLANGETVTFLVTDRSQIPYIELFSYRAAWRVDGIEATRICAVRWTDLDAFVVDMLGTDLYTPGNMVGGVVTNLKRYPPEPHPEYVADDGTSWMYAMEAQLLEGVGVPPTDQSDIAKSLSSSADFTKCSLANPDTFMVQFNLAKVAITYRPVDYFVYKDEDTPNTPGGELGRYLTRSASFAGENLPIPGNTFQYVIPGGPTSNPIPEAPPKTFPVAEIEYKWHRVPMPTFFSSTLLNAIGTINGTAFDNNFWAPETLLFLTPEIKPYRNPIGDYLYDISFKFLYRPNGHNHLYRGGGDQFANQR